ncbi:uncharacterized protein [Ptychodera flava]|uniref:uncharacterized protein n=1 Tax=Ptychodera flava TaxID=63121 RepID=UPI003969E6DE
MENESPHTPKIFRKRGRGGDFCCIPGCFNTRKSDKVKRSYFRFPPEKTGQFSLWTKSIRLRRAGWYPRHWDRVCSDHFINGVKSRNPDHPGYVPRIFKRNEVTPRKTLTSSKLLKSPLKEKHAIGQHQASRRVRRSLFRTKDATKGRPINNIAQVVTTAQPLNHDYLQTEVDLRCEEELGKYMPEIKTKIEELEEQVKLNSTRELQLLSLENIKDNPKEMQFYTGFPNFHTFHAVFIFLEPRAKNMQYWRGQATIDTQHFLDTGRYINKPGPERKLSLLEEFFLTIVRLKVGLLTEDIARRFNISLDDVFFELYSSCKVAPKQLTGYAINGGGSFSETGTASTEQTPQ